VTADVGLGAPPEVEAFCRARRLENVTPAAGGLDFTVYRASSRDHGAVAVRVPRRRVFSNANDRYVSSRDLLTQEFELARYLAARGHPVARPIELVRDDGWVDVLVSAYVDDDGSGFDSRELGRILAHLHGEPIPRLRLVAQEGLPAHELVARRLVERWAFLRRFAPTFPELPAERALAEVLEARAKAPSLLHLDVRAVNLRCHTGRIVALVDWSNAVAGDPALELARIAEYARLPENRLDARAVFEGYSELRPLDAATDAAFLVYRLDAAVMLSLVFRSEAPDPARAPSAAARALELAEAVRTALQEASTSEDR
jgi:aminoglycoside phosphotransferase (APT) family kinase protein